MNQTTLKTFTDSSRELLKITLEQIKEADAESYDGIAHAAGAGAFFEVTCALSMAGLLQPRVQLVTPSGERLNLGHVEYGEPTLN